MLAPHLGLVDSQRVTMAKRRQDAVGGCHRHVGAWNAAVLQEAPELLVGGEGVGMIMREQHPGKWKATSYACATNLCS